RRTKATPGADSIAAVYPRHRREGRAGFFEEAGADAMLESRGDSSSVEAANRRRVSPSAAGGGADPGGPEDTSRVGEGDGKRCSDGESAEAAGIGRQRARLQLDIRDGAVRLAELSEPSGGGRGRRSNANTVQQRQQRSGTRD